MYSEVKPIIDYNVRGLCRKPYHNHPKGCPNWGKDKCPPGLPKLEDFFDVTKPFYIIWNRFDIGEHIEKMRVKHPDWTDYQLRCVLYWQGTARVQLKKEIIKFKREHPECAVTTGPEAMGVNITETMKQAGIELEWPPMKYSYQVALAGTKKDDMIKSFEKFVINEGIRWYDKGKFSEEEPSTIDEVENFQIGDYVKKTGINYYRDHDGGWRSTVNVSDKYYKIINIRYIDTEEYKGVLIKFDQYWPWFQTTNFELKEK